MAQLDRATLEAFFESGDFPTEQQFADLIESTVNIVDDSPPLPFSASLSDTQILASFTTPIQVIPAQGADSIVNILAVASKLIFGGTAYTVGFGSRLIFTETNGAGANLAQQSSAFLANGADQAQQAELTVLAIDSVENTPIVVSSVISNPTLGNGTVEIRGLFSVGQF